MTLPPVVFHDSDAALAAALAPLVAADLAADIGRRGKAMLVLPGGSSPRPLMAALAREAVDWAKVVVTTTDERLVPPDSPDSNAGQVRTLLGVAPVWLGAVDSDFSSLPWPATVTVLGMGLDAHIASLFSCQNISDEKQRLIKTAAPVAPQARVSFTLSALLAAQRLILLVSGVQKWALCERIIKGDQQDTPLAALIARAGSRLNLHVINR